MERRMDAGYMDALIDQKIEEKIDALDEVIDQRIDEKIDDYKPLAELDPLIIFGFENYQSHPFDGPITLVDPFIINQIATLAKHINFVYYTSDSGHIRTQSFPIRAYGRETTEGFILVEKDAETGRYSFENNFVPRQQQFLLRTYSQDGTQLYVKKITLEALAQGRFKINPITEYSLEFSTGIINQSLDYFVVLQIYFSY